MPKRNKHNKGKQQQGKHKPNEQQEHATEEDEVDVAIKVDRVSRAQDLPGTLRSARDRFKDSNKLQGIWYDASIRKINELKAQTLQTMEDKLNANAARQREEWVTKVRNLTNDGLTLTSALELINDLAGRLAKAQRMIVEQDMRTRYVMRLMEIKEDVAINIIDIHQKSVENLFDLNLILRTWAETLEEATRNMLDAASTSASKEQSTQTEMRSDAAPEEFSEWKHRVLQLERQMGQLQMGQSRALDEQHERGRLSARMASSSATRAAMLLEAQVHQSRRNATPRGWRPQDVCDTVKAAQELAFAVRTEEGQVPLAVIESVHAREEALMNATPNWSPFQSPPLNAQEVQPDDRKAVLVPPVSRSEPVPYYPAVSILGPPN